MFGSFLPREGRFFDLFREASELIVLGSTEFKSMLQDLAHAESRSRNIKDIEHRCDKVTHQTVELLHTTFITPMDRDEIHTLISRLDDILDYIEAASTRVFLYDIKAATPEMVELANICCTSAEKVRDAIRRLDNLKDPAEIRALCVEINRLENDADHVLRSGMAKLFREENDVKQLIKLKEIYELLETVTDRCEDVANVIESIVLENC